MKKKCELCKRQAAQICVVYIPGKKQPRQAPLCADHWESWMDVKDKAVAKAFTAYLDES